MENLSQYSESAREIVVALIAKHRVPEIHHYPLFVRAQLAKESNKVAFRHQWMTIRLRAWEVLARSSVEPGLTALLRAEPETVTAMAAVAIATNVPSSVRAAAAKTLGAITSEGARVTTIIAAGEWNVPHGRMPTSLRTAIAALRNPSELESVHVTVPTDVGPVVDALLQCGDALSLSSTGAAALKSAGIFSLVLPLLSFRSSALPHLRVNSISPNNPDCHKCSVSLGIDGGLRRYHDRSFPRHWWR